MIIQNGESPSEKLVEEKIMIVHKKRIGFKEPKYTPYPSEIKYPSTELFPKTM